MRRCRKSDAALGCTDRFPYLNRLRLCVSASRKVRDDGRAIGEIDSAAYGGDHCRHKT